MQSQLALQAYLAEFAALRQELLEMLKWRDQLVFVSLATSGALFSFAFSSTAGGAESSRRLALYLIPPLSTAIGGLWLHNGLRAARIGAYIRDVIAPGVRACVTADASPDASASDEDARLAQLFSWESSPHRSMHGGKRRLAESFAAMTSFVGTGALAQLMLWRGLDGQLRPLQSLEMPTIFVLNGGFTLLWVLWTLRPPVLRLLGRWPQ